MAHADDAVGALHAGNEAKRAHNVRLQWRKGATAHRSVEGKSVPLDLEAQSPVREQVFPNLDAKYTLKGTELRIRQPPGLPARKDLKGSAAPSRMVDVIGRDEGEGVPLPCLELPIPALEIRSLFSRAVVLLCHSRPSVLQFTTW